MNKETFFAEIEKLVTKYKNKEHPEKPVAYTSPQKILQKISKYDFKPKNYEQLFEQVGFYMEKSVYSNHPHFNNQLYAGDSEVGLVGEIISYITNNSMATFETSPVGTLLEEKLIQKINSLIRFKNGEGLMVPGGSNANMMAIHLARNKYHVENKNKGNCGLPFVIFVSEDAHYSFGKAANILGLGQDNVIGIKTNKDHRMSVSDLESKIKEHKNKGNIPLCVISTAGTTVYGAFDSIEKIDIIAKKYSIWHHVDAAWGAAAIFSKKLSKKMSGIQNVDSVTWDAHKLMGTGLLTAFILVRKKGSLESANAIGGESYLFHKYDNAEYDTGTKSLQCARKNDALKLWFAWQFHGDSGYETFIDKQREKATYLKNQIKKDSKNFKLISDTGYLNICFQITPKNTKNNINTYNRDIRFRLVQETSHMVNMAQSKNGEIFFRYTFANNNTKKSDLRDFLDTLLKLKKQL